MWTALIVLQVALAVAALPAAIHHAVESHRIGREAAPAVAGALLRTKPALANQADAQSASARFWERTRVLMERLGEDPQVQALIFAQEFPGSDRRATIETEAGSARKEGDGSPTLVIRARTNWVAINLFDVFEVPLLAGRTFIASDATVDATSVIVDQTFADRIGGGNVIGRRLRSTRLRGGQTVTSPWLEIVGVVPAFADDVSPDTGFVTPPLPRVYRAVAAGQIYPAALIVRLRSSAAAAFAPRLRQIAAGVDPNLRLERLDSVRDAWVRDRFAFRMMALGITAVTISMLLLSAAGIYAMISFTVVKRRREIGIRAALGADTRRVLASIFARAGAQLGAGIALGLAVAAAAEWLIPGGTMGSKAPVLLPTVVVVISAIGLLAALGPARRGLAVHPIEALRDE
jgi:hypothetical protein